MAIRASEPPASATKRSRMSGLSNFSSPPPTARIEPWGRGVRGFFILGTSEYAVRPHSSTSASRATEVRLSRQVKSKRPRFLSSTALIFYALILGVVAGHLFPAETHPAAYESFRFLSKAFISLIKMLIVPLIFSTIVVGIGKTGDVKVVGRMGVKALIYFELATTAALALGLTIAHVVKPGHGLTLPPSGEQLAQPKTLVETLLHLFPSNVIDAMAKQDILQVVIFATLVGVAAAHVQAKSGPFLKFFDSAVAVMFQLTDYVMSLTPLGVFGAMAGAVSHHGLTVLGSYAKLVASLYGALVLFALLVLVPALLIVRANLRVFFRKIREPFLLAFSTASSEAALPRALEKMVEFGVPESVAGFVIPAGYSFNLDGSTLYISLAALTIAQAAHVELSALDRASDDADLPHDLQGRRRRSARLARRDRGRMRLVRPSGRSGRGDDPRGGRADGHGAHVRQRDGQLRRVRRGRTLGRGPRGAAAGRRREFPGSRDREAGRAVA